MIRFGAVNKPCLNYMIDISDWGICCVTVDFCCEKSTFFLTAYFIGFIGISWSNNPAAKSVIFERMY